MVTLTITPAGSYNTVKSLQVAPRLTKTRAIVTQDGQRLSFSRETGRLPRTHSLYFRYSVDPC